MPRAIVRRRRKPRRRRRKYAPLTNFPCPSRRLVKLRYVDTVSINAGAGTTGTYVFRANDLRDPDFSGGGHQPLGFDENMEFYNHFTVLGSKIKCIFQATSNTIAFANQICGVELEDDTTYEPDPRTIMEQPNTKYSTLGVANGSRSMTTVSKGFSAKKFFGLSTINGLSQYRGNTAASPTEGAYYIVWTGSSDATSDADAVQVQVIIEYIAMLTERKDLAQS